MCKQVNQYDLQGNLIKTWGKIRDVEKLFKINRGHISECCKGKQK